MGRVPGVSSGVVVSVLVLSLAAACSRPTSARVVATSRAPTVKEPPSTRVGLGEGLELEVSWNDTCEFTRSSRDRVEGEQGPTFELGRTTTSTWLGECNGRRFDVTARCSPGPCGVLAGHRGSDRRLHIGFGAPGVHELHLAMRGEGVETEWVKQIEVVVADEIRIACRVIDWSSSDPCPAVVHTGRHGDVVVAISVAVLAGDAALEGARPTLTVNGERRAPDVDSTRWNLRLGVGQYAIEARFGELVTELPLDVRRPAP
jgi:hypothetical protein